MFALALDNPFCWSANPELGQQSALPVAGLHFGSFTATSQQFQAIRLAMVGVMPNGLNMREAPYNIGDDANGINQVTRAMHQQNCLIPPREWRSFPLAELQAGIQHLYLPVVQSANPA